MSFKSYDMELRMSRKTHTCSRAILTGASGGPAGDGAYIVSGCDEEIPKKTLYAVQFTWEHADIGPFYGKLCMKCALWTGAARPERAIVRRCKDLGVDLDTYLQWALDRGHFDLEHAEATPEAFLASR
jgi:hypothetical protein